MVKSYSTVHKAPSKYFIKFIMYYSEYNIAKDYCKRRKVTEHL